MIELHAVGVDRRQRVKNTLVPGRNYEIGRALELDLPIPWDPHISRRHVRLKPEADFVDVEEQSTALVFGGYGAYGLSDMFDANLELMASGHEFVPGQTTRVYSAAAGLTYKVDVIEWVPYVGGLLGWYAFDGGPAPEAPPPERVDAAPAADVASEDAAAAEAEERTAAITARVVDPSGRPLEGATVELTDVPGHRGTATADGTVRMTGEVPEAFVPWLGDHATFRVSRAGYTTEEARARLVLGEDVPLGDVVLRPGATVVGRVEDADGRPAAGVRVWSVVLVDGKPMTAEALNSEARATTDAAGRFELAGVPAGVIRIEAVGAEQERAHSAGFELGAGDLVEGIGISLPPTEERPPHIEGVVVDPDGAPVLGASVKYAAKLGRSRVSGSTRSDEDGAFLIVANIVAEHRLFATSPAGEYRASEAVHVGPGDRVTLRLRPSRTFDVVAIGGGDETLREFSAFTRTGESLVNTFARTDDGRVALQLPDVPFTLVVEAPHHDRTEVGPLDPARVLADGVVEVAVRALPGLTGVVTLAGEPVAGAAVRVHRMATGRTDADGFPVRVSPPREAQGTTGADGSFVLTLREAGAYVVRVEADGAAPAEVGPFEFEPTVGVAPLDVRLGEGGVLAGRVLPPPGRSAAGTIVGISRGDGYARTVRVGADGRFRFERLIPGRYHVVRHDRELRPGPPQSFGTSGEPGVGEIPWSCELFEGQTTRHDLDLSICVLRGRLRPGGEEATASRVSLVDPASAAAVGAPASPAVDGSFTLVAPVAGAYLLRVVGADGETRLEEPIEVRWGETRWSGGP